MLILRMNEINFFERLKTPNEMGRSQTINEHNEKSRTSPSLCIPVVLSADQYPEKTGRKRCTQLHTGAAGQAQGD